jgi:hypothetical protein
MKTKLLKAGFSIANYSIFFVIILAPNIAIAQVANENLGNKLTSGRLESALGGWLKKPNHGDVGGRGKSAPTEAKKSIGPQ